MNKCKSSFLQKQPQLKVLWMWWDVADWGGLSIWSLGVWMIGYQPVERWRWKRPDIRGGIGWLGKNEWIVTWDGLLYILNERYSGMCGDTSPSPSSSLSFLWMKKRYLLVQMLQYWIVVNIFYCWNFRKSGARCRAMCSDRCWYGEKQKKISPTSDGTNYKSVDTKLWRISVAMRD